MEQHWAHDGGDEQQEAAIGDGQNKSSYVRCPTPRETAQTDDGQDRGHGYDDLPARCVWPSAIELKNLTQDHRRPLCTCKPGR